MIRIADCELSPANARCLSLVRTHTRCTSGRALSLGRADSCNGDRAQCIWVDAGAYSIVLD